MSGRWVAVAGALALAVLPVLAGCDDAKQSSGKPISEGVKQCRAQWHEVAESVIGLDEETYPSALASRWTSVIATVDYYETSSSEKDCQARIDSQVNAISALRQFSERLRPYDMTYQRDRVSAAVDLYLHDPVPEAVTGAHGKKIKPPSHQAVRDAVATLTNEAAAADAELQPGWAQLASVSLDDEAAISAALRDLDLLAQNGAHWTACQQALQVIVAATRAQEGLLGTPEDQASASPSPTAAPTATPTS